MDSLTRPLAGLVRLVLSVVLTLGTLGLVTAAGVASASAAPSSKDVSVTLKSLTPGTLTGSEDLQVTVTVRNTGSAAITGGGATLLLGSQALDSLDKQENWEASQRDLTSDAKATASVSDLQPGASTDVSLTLPSSKIDASYDMTTLPVEVQVKGTESGTSLSGAMRTSVPWTSSTGSYTKMTTQMIVPITLPADPRLFTATGAARFEAWNKAIGPNSPIDQLLSSNPSMPVTWLVDPTVLDPPTAQDARLPSTATLAGDGSNNPANGASPTSSASSKTTESSTSSPTSGGSSAGSSGNSSAPSSGASSSSTQQPTTVDQLAERLRTRLQSRPSTQQVWFTPYGDPDLSTLTSSHRPQGADAMLRRMLARQLPTSLTGLSTTMVAAPSEPLDAASSKRLSDAWYAARHSYPSIVTPSTTLTGSTSANVTSAAGRDRSGRLLLGVDSALSETLASSEMTDASAATSARARSLAIYQQRPNATRSILAMAPRETISPSRLEAVTSALASVPWVQTSLTSIGDSLSKAASVTLQTTQPADDDVWPQPGTAALSSTDVATISGSLRDLDRYADIVADGSDLVPAWSRSVDQPASTRWRDHGDLAHGLTTTTRSTIESVPSHVSVLPSGTINFFTDSGNLTVTIRNDLARTVSGVRLHLVPRSYAVRFTSQADPVNIDAGSRAGLRIPTAAQAAGSVDVLATVTARNGVQLGQGADDPVRFTINARPTGTWIYWALGIVALLVFCYGLARNRKKGTRRRDELARDIQL